MVPGVRRRCIGRGRTMGGVRRMRAVSSTVPAVHRARVQHSGIAENHGEPEREQCVQRSGEAGKAAHERA